ncbi:MAG: ABC transporter permease [Candidatus Limnocylindria bacterium]
MAVLTATALDVTARTRALLASVPKVYWALLALIFLLGIVSPRSVEPRHLLDLARQGSALGLVALGQTVVILTGGLDLSVGSIVILADVVAAQLIAGRDERVIPVILLVLLLGSGVGLLNGLLVTRFRITPFIATLGIGLIVTGAALVYSRGAPGGSIPASMRFWGNGFIAGSVPAAAAVWLGASLLVAALIKRTVLGRRLVAVGANPKAAHVAGVRVDRTLTGAYVISGFMAAAGGLLLVAFIGIGTLEVGTDFLLGSIAATIIGGTVFTGGRGTIWGTVGGVLFLMGLYSILTVLNLPISGRRVVEGSIIVVALALYARSRE